MSFYVDDPTICANVICHHFCTSNGYDTPHCSCCNGYEISSDNVHCTSEYRSMKGGLDCRGASPPQLNQNIQ